MARGSQDGKLGLRTGGLWPPCCTVGARICAASRHAADHSTNCHHYNGRFFTLPSASMIESAILWLLALLALPQVGLSAVFVISFVAATLVPMGSEPTVFAVIKANDALYWSAIAVATAGNTLGGALDYWIGYGASKTFDQERTSGWFQWLQRYGAKAMLLAWLPAIGDPLCTLGGWLRLPFWPSIAYMALGKFARYVTITSLLLHVPDGFWRRIAHWLG